MECHRTAIVTGTTATLKHGFGSVVDLTSAAIVRLRNLTIRWGSSFGAG
jgi:hypothetical protein